LAAAPEYAIFFMEGATERLGRSGLSHAEAMAGAEETQREGWTARIIYVVGVRTYEGYSYPVR
jgi:hypothetical protein